MSEVETEVTRVVYGKHEKFYIRPDQDGLGLVVLTHDKREVYMNPSEALAVAKALQACANELREADVNN